MTALYQYPPRPAPRLASRTFALGYVCSACGWTTATETTDCPTCRQPTVLEQIQDVTPRMV